MATEALQLRDNLADVLDARAMMCVHGDAGLGKTLSVNAALRALAPADVCRVQFRARPTPRDIRHVLFDALGCSGAPPMRPIEFDALLKQVLAERPRVLTTSALTKRQDLRSSLPPSAQASGRLHGHDQRMKYSPVHRYWLLVAKVGA